MWSVDDAGVCRNIKADDDDFVLRITLIIDIITLLTHLR
jgi:hypothetical protein